MKQKTFIHTIARAALTLTLALLTNITAWAEFDGTYIDENGEEQTSQTIFPIEEFSNGYEWYYVEGEVNINHGLKFYKDTHLLLCDNATLTITCDDIAFDLNGHSLTIYGQSAGTGKLIATSTDCWGIENFGGIITINGGTVEVTSERYWGIKTGGGSLTLNRGYLKATGGEGYPGINVGGGTITLNGGYLKATGGDGAPGIEVLSGSITLNGGAVKSNGYVIYSNEITIAQGWTYTDGSTNSFEGKTTITPTNGATYQPEWTGSGTSEADPYVIKTPADLDLLAKRVNSGADSYGGKYFQLGADIAYDPDVLTIDNDEDGTDDSNFTAIGEDNGYNSFSGHFDGNNHTISGIRINKVAFCQGLFGCIKSTNDNTAEVKNVILDDAIIKALVGCGGIVGFNDGGIINGCTSAAKIIRETSSGAEYGGIAGTNKGTVSNCLYIGNTVEGTSSVGAIVGFNNGGTVSNCYFTSTAITGKDIDGNALDNANSALGVNEGTATNVGLARTLTLAEGITLYATPTAYGPLTAYGDFALSYNDGTVTTLYSAEGNQVALHNTATGAPLGYQYGFTVKNAGDNDITADNLSGSTLTMPDNNVTVSSNTSQVCSTGQPVAVSYVDENGETQTAQAIALDGTETTLGGGWYFVGLPEVNFDHTLTLSEKAHLILADGKTMNVGTSESRISGRGINGDYLTIYGQADGTGTLSIYSSDRGIYAYNDLTINGGKIIANTTGSSAYALLANMGGITINGGHVIANTTGSSAHALYTLGNNITINGGTVEATATGSDANAIYAWYNFYYYGGDVTTSAPNGKAINAPQSHFRWSNTTDRFAIGSTGLNATEGTDVSFYSEFPFTDGSTIYESFLTGPDDLAALAGKTLVPYIETMSLAARQAPDGNNWTTFYCGKRGFTIDADENACAYTATYDATAGQLILHNQGKQIPRDCAVIIVADPDNSSIGMTATTLPVFNGDNALKGEDEDISTADLLNYFGAGTLYVLGQTTVNTANGPEQHFGFHRYTGTEMAARKAYLHVPGNPSSEARSLDMVFGDDATGVEEVIEDSGVKEVLGRAKRQSRANDDSWYTINGVKLNGKPTKPGLYINKGMKVVIK